MYLSQRLDLLLTARAESRDRLWMWFTAMKLTEGISIQIGQRFKVAND